MNGTPSMQPDAGVRLVAQAASDLLTRLPGSLVIAVGDGGGVTCAMGLRSKGADPVERQVLIAAVAAWLAQVSAAEIGYRVNERPPAQIIAR